jgi:hypothetical protein
MSLTRACLPPYFPHNHLLLTKEAEIISQIVQGRIDGINICLSLFVLLSVLISIHLFFICALYFYPCFRSLTRHFISYRFIALFYCLVAHLYFYF